ncbi:hypothetical protein [uncultured Prevotella sp.]|uniref:hypothetical protein n=1 Tax=uncultured Prevotella sp. TaxID=159272 RepID=UPI0025ED62C0|nr:hypothetical protein [uncultured Prevotella sp.]
MTNIKMIYFDSVAIDPILFESRLRTICASLYVIKEGLLLVNFDGDSKILFDQLFPNQPTNNVFIVDLETNADSYWGFMNKDLWTWLNDNEKKSI